MESNITEITTLITENLPNCTKEEPGYILISAFANRYKTRSYKFDNMTIPFSKYLSAVETQCNGIMFNGKRNKIIENNSNFLFDFLNLCNYEKFDFSVSFLKQEIERCEQLGITKLVLHPGSSVGLERNHAISNIIKGLNIILDNNYNVIICLETMAGKGTEVGKSFEELKFIIDHVNNKSRIGVCLDTCHIHDAGYDLNDFDAVLDEFERVIGLSYLKCLHINDSKNEKESHKDRHENIGYGCIGFDNLIHIIYHKKLEKIPKILETPYIEKEYPPYKQEIDMILDKVFNEKLKEEVIDYYQR